MTIRTKVRVAIAKHLGKYISLDKEKMIEIVKKGVIHPKDDSGEWAPESEVIINLESGIPSGEYHPILAEAWEEVSSQLNDKGLFLESVNTAIYAVYKA
jgi:hypothetical protein